MSIEAMKQWREALESWKKGFSDLWQESDEQALKSIDQAIAEAEKQEAKAWIHKQTGVITKEWSFDKDLFEPLYTHPQPKQELTNDVTVAGLKVTIGHLSALVDNQYELLQEVNDVCGRDGHGGELEDGESDLIDRVRQHLKTVSTPQPKQEQGEPVGKFAKFTDGIWREVTDGSAGVPLYTIPPQRKPLTFEQADDVALDIMGVSMLDKEQAETAHLLIRATEAAHGIKE